ncbi:uncharacterized protein LOC126741363 [Anthonomus grandis grandis]|uniref:uncharacterized protein LOC126741363 n=1 Tax=Anthonomus grandis grandis TaxID=2921223 RepID=UPI0021665A14|nr:uncharacterized protein LOC126741363 [Anthonomus grandis grandis]
MEAVDCLFEGSFNHKGYNFEIDFSCETQSNLNYVEFYYDFKMGDYIGINNYLCEINWDLVLSSADINIAVSHFYHILDMAIALFVPLKRYKTSKFPSWFSAELRYLVRLKKIAHKCYRVSHNVADYITFSNIRARCKTLTDICYDNYISNLDQLLYTNPKSFWYNINNKRSNNKLPNLMYYNDNEFVGCEQIAEGFAQFFSTVYSPINNINNNGTFINQQAKLNMTIPNPTLSIGLIFDKITKLPPKVNSGPDGIPNYFLIKCVCTISYPLFIVFKRSLDSAIFPTLWKHSFVMPIFKSCDNSKIENYRSVCIQSAIPKLLDSLIYDQLYFYCKELLLSEQHGFISGKSTVTNLLVFQQNLLNALERGCQMDVIYTDFSRAFDRVDHSILGGPSRHE